MQPNDGALLSPTYVAVFTPLMSDDFRRDLCRVQRRESVTSMMKVLFLMLPRTYARDDVAMRHERCRIQARRYDIFAMPSLFFVERYCPLNTPPTPLAFRYHHGSIRPPFSYRKLSGTNRGPRGTLSPLSRHATHELPR